VINTKFLTGILALIVITSGTQAVFAQVGGEPGDPDPGWVMPTLFGMFTEPDPGTIIYENGNPDPFDGNKINGLFTNANDFILTSAADLTDVHLIVLTNTPGPIVLTGPVHYEIRADAGGIPGALIDSGIGQNVDTEALPDGPFGARISLWFDTENPIPLLGGTTFWLTIHTDDDQIIRSLFWEKSDVVIGNNGMNSQNNGVTWDDIGIDLWFQLTSKPDVVVGGEFLPIDSTALMLAGAQSFSWMIPVVLSVLGIGLFVVSRKSE